MHLRDVGVRAETTHKQELCRGCEDMRNAMKRSKHAWISYDWTLALRKACVAAVSAWLTMSLAKTTMHHSI